MPSQGRPPDLQAAAYPSAAAVDAAEGQPSSCGTEGLQAQPAPPEIPPQEAAQGERLSSAGSSALSEGPPLALPACEGAFQQPAADAEAKGWVPPARGPRSLASLLPSISALPPLLHRYTGTTTESLLVGITCCLVNTALYVTSGIFTRVLQQQEHMGPQKPAPCPPELPGEPAAAADCVVSPPEAVAVQRFRVPYLMVWLPQACQVVFLFIALASIRRRYQRRPTVSAALGREVGAPEEGAPLPPSWEQQEAAGGAPPESGPSHEEEAASTVRPSHAAARETAGLTSEEEEDKAAFHSAAAASNEGPVETGSSSSSSASKGELLLRGERPSRELEAAAASSSCPCTASCAYTVEDGGHLGVCGQLWEALKSRVKSSVYEGRLKEYHLCVQAFLKDEMKYESLGKLVVACFLLTCLYTLQSWFWSIAVGTTGMSVCSVTAIYSTNPLFVFLFTSLFYKEGMDDFIQLVALVLASVGVALIAYDSQGEPQSTAGVVLSVCSSATYGLFEVLYKKYLLQSRSTHPLTFVFFVSGLMGALSLLFMWIPIPLLHAMDWEAFPSSPPPLLALFLLTLSCVCSSVYIILLQVSLLLLPSPLLVAMCFLLSLPPAAASDALRGGGGGVGGPGCAFIGFALAITGIKEWNIKEREEQEGPHLGDLCVPFVFNSEARLSSYFSHGSEPSELPRH